MAEYKTYTCDRCGKIGAEHYIFPSIDSVTNAAGDIDYIDGVVDLCPKHSHMLLHAFFGTVDMTYAGRRKLFTTLTNACAAHRKPQE